MKSSFLALLGLCVFAVSCSTKLPEAQITFHTQTPPGEMKTMIFPYTHKGRIISMRRIPSFTIIDVATYQPFVAKDSSYGAILTLDRTAAGRLYNHTVENKGAYMISIANGNTSIPLKIDKPIKDGKLIIWDGLTQQDIYLFDLQIRRDGDDEDATKARIKNAKTRLKDFKIGAEKD